MDFDFTPEDEAFRAEVRKFLKQHLPKKQSFEALAEWQKDWPADPKPLIALRLKAFLAACSDVDFAATLIHDPTIDKKRFAETRYEMKPAEWKLCYRAGKAPVDAARGFAQAWLKELPAR